MKLHTFGFKRAVTQAHDDAVARFRTDFQTTRKRFPLHDQRVIPRRRQRIRQPAKNPFAVVFNLTRLPMEQSRRPDDFPAKGRADGLVPEANSENWIAARELLD